MIENIIVGAGPIGIEVAAALKKAGLNYLHIEAGSIASTIAWWAPGTQIFSSPERIAIAAVPFEVYPNNKSSREEYLNYLRAVVKQFDLKIRLNTRVIKIAKAADSGFLLEVSPSMHGVGGAEEYQNINSLMQDFGEPEFLYAKNIILAIGDMHLPKELGIEGERQPNVSHFFQEPHRYFGSKVVIVGAKNSAAEAVVRLARIGCDVTWCCRAAGLDERKIKPWILPEALGLIREGRIKFLTEVIPLGINGRFIYIKTIRSGEEKCIEADFFLLLTGYRQDNKLFKQLGVNLIGDGSSPEFNSETMETNVPGVYVAGTAIAGTQVGGAKIFIENCHMHSLKIAKALGAHFDSFPANLDRPQEQREQ